MKHLYLLLLALCLPALAEAQEAPAFPGAEGHGRYTQGGRGGRVIVVTNLNDDGDGSLRKAVKGDAKKIIVFNVGGVIALKSELKIGANTTIEGQTAPAPGITLRYFTVRPGANNIIRFLRSRRGQERDVNEGADAIWNRNLTGLILDHCSFSWSIDEVASFYDNNNFTMQWCTIAESLCNAGHGKGSHGYGGIWGGKLASFHHNLIAHVANRGPRFNGARYNWGGYTQNKEYAKYGWKNAVEAENVDFRNCVMYEAQDTCYGGPGGGQINMVGNYYRAGDSGRGNQERITIVSVGDSDNAKGFPALWGMTSRYFIEGNTLVKADGTVSKKANWDCIAYDDGILAQNGQYYTPDKDNYYTRVAHTTVGGISCVPIRMETPIATGSVTTHAAATAFERVVAYAGASLSRDNVDERYASEARTGKNTYTGSVTGKKGLIDVVADCEGYTEATFPTASRPDGYDTDLDGMPDEWESRHGLNPADPADAALFSLDSKGFYTNVEIYCNSLVEDIMKAGNAGGEANYTEYYPKAAAMPSSITTPERGLPAHGEVYNLRGQRVAPHAKGITIENGRKSVNR